MSTEPGKQRPAEFFSVEVDGRPIAVPPGTTLMEAAELAGVPVPASCPHTGQCRECLVTIQAGEPALSPPTPEEALIPPGHRLACRAQIVAGEPAVSFAPARHGELRIEIAGTIDGLALLGRQDVPAATRAGGQLFFEGVSVGAISGPPLGLAVDLGTTTVVARLVDLEERRILAARAFENPQRRWAAEVMSRIQTEVESLGRPLQRAILEALGDAVVELCGAQRRPEEIVEVIIAGNTAMRDIFFGLDVSTVGVLPFRSLTEGAWRRGDSQSSAVIRPASELGLALHPDARVVGLPVIACHVGADAAAAALALDFLALDEPGALIDFGSNTEILVRTGGSLLVASCPAGPAFEGGGVQCGMPAFEGAVEHVAIENDGTVRLSVIGGGEPRGVCGSGLVDALGELCRLGLVTPLGRFVDGASHFVLSAEHDLVLSEHDINLLLQAKAANISGALLTLEESGLDPGKLRRIYLAGGFINRIDLDAAVRIGFLPDLPRDLYVKVGNAAIEGATMTLCSTERRHRLERVVEQARHLQLEAHDQFFDRFVDGCQLNRCAR